MYQNFGVGDPTSLNITFSSATSACLTFRRVCSADWGGDHLKIIVCGSREAVDDFIDGLHKELEKFAIQGFEVEPFLKDRDYRGVFRIVE